MRATFEEDLKEVKVEWATALKEVEYRWQKKVSQLKQIAREKESEIRQVTEKREAGTEAHLQTLALLSVKEEELNQSEKQWKDKCAALEESLRKELVVKERWERKGPRSWKKKRWRCGS